MTFTPTTTGASPDPAFPALRGLFVGAGLFSTDARR